MPSLSDQALQMENLIRTLIPFKLDEYQRLQENKKLDLEQTTKWWDRMIENVNEEIRILSEHAAALGMDTALPLDPEREKRKQALADAYAQPLMTEEEKAAAQKLLGTEPSL